MKIKYRITLLFTVLVLTILLLLNCAIYYYAEKNRENNFKNRLRNRALTAAKYLIDVTGKDQDLMKKIDENTVMSLKNASVVVYNYQKQPIYIYSETPGDSVSYSKDIINKAIANGEYFFKVGKQDVFSTQYIDRFNRYVIVVSAYDKDGVETTRNLKGILVFSFFAGVIITVITGYYFSIRLVRPITGIIETVKEISSHSLALRLDAKEKQDELGQLAATFNQLLDRLQESFETQRSFISNASHELCTPLAAASSQIEIVLQKDRPAGEYKEVLESIHCDVVQMGHLTRGLLEIAKAGSGGAIELNAIRIDELLLRIAGDIKKIDPKYTVKLSFDEFPDEDDAFLVFGNIDLLYSAIRNIIANACKFSYNSVAEVHLNISTEAVRIRVEDEGIGIPEADVENIFQPFYRAENSGEKKGFGLGLALAKRIIRLHDGDIFVASEFEKGSVFTIILKQLK